MSTLKRIFGLLTLLTLAACGSQAPDAQAPGKEHRPHHYIGKPRAPIQARLVSVPSLHAGVPAQLVLEVTAGMAVDSLEVTLEGDAGLSVISARSHRLAALRAGESRRMRLDLTPSSGGERRLTALLTAEVAGQRYSRPISLPLPVAGPVTVQPQAAKPGPEPVRDATGTLVYSMEAETTVR